MLSLFVTSCGSDSGTATETETTAKVKREPRPTEISIKAMSPSPSFPKAGFTSMSYQDGTFRFGLMDSRYKLQMQTDDAPQKMCANSSKGQHIHLIVDNEPYAAKYTAEFDHEIPDGEHYILAFLSRSYHESIKTTPAYKAVKATIENNTITNMESIVGPMLFYSRPKGTYVGEDTDNVMLDFYVLNRKLGRGFSVRAEVGDKTFEIDTWQPYILNGLPYGENTITLTLLDADGAVVDAPNNPVSRTFTLLEDKAEE
jgi:hypothetical protein